MNLCPELRRLQAEHARWLAVLGREGEEGRAARLLALWEEEILPHCRREEEISSRSWPAGSRRRTR